MSEPEAGGCVPFWRPGKDYANEPEGDRVPEGTTVVDAHVHIFPESVMNAIFRWFDANAWSCRYRMQAEQTTEFLLGRGVKRFCALHYAHKPGLAPILNRFAAEAARAHPEILPLGTVLPGEPGAREILREALGPLGLRGIKIHCHVQRLGPDDPRMEVIYEECEAAGRPLVIHAGREPNLRAYGLDTHALCGVDQIDHALKRHPRLRIVVPHLGADEFAGYLALLDVHENLYLDTTMVVGDYFEVGPPPELYPARASRLLYGTDFPMIPYAWDHELSRIVATDMPEDARAALLAGNALRLFDGVTSPC